MDTVLLYHGDMRTSNNHKASECTGPDDEALERTSNDAAAAVQPGESSEGKPKPKRAKPPNPHFISPREIEKDTGRGHTQVYVALRNGLLPSLPWMTRNYLTPRPMYEKWKRGELAPVHCRYCHQINWWTDEGVLKIIDAIRRWEQSGRTDRDALNTLIDAGIVPLTNRVSGDGGLPVVPPLPENVEAAMRSAVG